MESNMRALPVLTLLLLFAFGGSLAAQGLRRGNPIVPKQPNTDKQREDAQRRAKQAQAEKEKDEREAARESAKAEREAKNGESTPKEEPIKPGDTVPEEIKTTWIDLEMTKLGIESKSSRAAFSKIVLKAWKDSEAEDARYAKDFNAVKSDESLLEVARKTHQDKLKKIWDDADTDLKKKNMLDDAKLATFKIDSKSLREKTATDKFEENEKAKSTKKAPKKKAESEEGSEAPKTDKPSEG